MSLDAARATGPRAGNIKSRKMADLVASRLRMMIATGELTEGDWLPTEAELTEQFGVSRPTLREAFRLLEGDGLVHIRRGPPGGARVQLPGPEQAARLFGLILTLSGTTLQDVYAARMVIEPPAVRQIAETPHPEGIAELREAIELARGLIDQDEAFAAATTDFHLRLVRVAGNHTLAAVVGMLSEITTRHVAAGYRETRKHNVDDITRRNERALRAYDKVVTLAEEGQAEEAETYWRRHMERALEVISSEVGAAHAVIDVLE